MDKKGGNLLSLSLFTHLLRVPDVRLFHAHALKRLGGEVRTVARLRRKPLVVSLHGGVFDVPAAELDSMLRPIANKTEWGKPFGALFGSRRVLDDGRSGRLRRPGRIGKGARTTTAATTALFILPQRRGHGEIHPR